MSIDVDDLLQRSHPNPDRTPTGAVKVHFLVDRRRSRVYLKWADVDRANALLEDGWDVLWSLQEFVDLRRGADGETVGYLAVDESTGEIEDVHARPGYLLQEWSA